MKSLEIGSATANALTANLALATGAAVLAILSMPRQGTIEFHATDVNKVSSDRLRHIAHVALTTQRSITMANPGQTVHGTDPETQRAYTDTKLVAPSTALPRGVDRVNWFAADTQRNEALSVNAVRPGVPTQVTTMNIHVSGDTVPTITTMSRLPDGQTEVVQLSATNGQYRGEAYRKDGLGNRVPGGSDTIDPIDLSEVAEHIEHDLHTLAGAGGDLEAVGAEGVVTTG
jgi:hypothetical protein